MSSLFLSYWTVLVAELIGDRSIYTVASLAMRFQPRWVFCGIAAAFCGKMLVAVWCGRLLSELPPLWTGAISAVTFLASAACIWWHRENGETPDAEVPGKPPARPPWTNAVWVAFFSVFFAEWADLGQISAAALVMRFHAPGPVWLGGSLALCTKGGLAIVLGLSLRERFPRRLVRIVSASSCLLLALVSLYSLGQ